MAAPVLLLCGYDEKMDPPVVIKLVARQSG